MDEENMNEKTVMKESKKTMMFLALAIGIAGMFFFIWRGRMSSNPNTAIDNTGTSAMSQSQQTFPQNSSTTAGNNPEENIAEKNMDKEDMMGETKENKTGTVTITQTGFVPSSVTIKKGSTITWVNKSGMDVSINSDDHPSHLLYPPLNLGVVANNASISMMFDEIGTYPYHDHFDAVKMGTIMVEE